MSISTATGSTNYIELTTASNWIQTGRAFTVMAWVNLSSTATDYSCICSSFDGSTTGWEFGAKFQAAGAVTPTVNSQWYFGWNNPAATFWGDEGLATNFGSLGGVLSANTWYHLCVRYGLDGGTQNDKVQDGIELGVGGTSAQTAIASAVRKLRIHHSSDNSTAGMPGKSCYIRMFEGCLNIRDIRLLRISRRIPNYLIPLCIIDVPLDMNNGSTTYAFDQGPKNLGSFTKGAGTVNYADNP